MASSAVRKTGTANWILDNPNETIITLTEQSLSPDELDGLATRPNHFEIMAVTKDVWDQLSQLEMFKEGCHVQDKVKNSLRYFTYNYVDLDLKEFNLDCKKIRILNNLTINFAILKPDKGNGIVLKNEMLWLYYVCKISLQLY